MSPVEHVKAVAVSTVGLVAVLLAAGITTLLVGEHDTGVALLNVGIGVVVGSSGAGVAVGVQQRRANGGDTTPAAP